MSYQKDLDSWNSVKKKVHAKPSRTFYKEREIWWCSLGKNVGDEQDGKGPQSARPVLVIKKFNKNIFLGIPLSTQIKETNYYYKFDFKGNTQCLILSQVRLIDSKRLLSKMERISENHFKIIMDDFLKYVFNAKTISP